MKTKCRISYSIKRILLVALVLMAVLCKSIFTQAATFSPRLSAPSEDSPYYSNGAYNPYVAVVGTLRGVPNCTTYAWGRAYEILGTWPSLPSSGDAGSWYGAASNKGPTPQLGAVACWNNGGFGHVAVVEEINGNEITISQSSYSPSNYWFKETKNITNMGAGFQGYIYIGDSITLLSSSEIHLTKGQTYQIEVQAFGKVEWKSDDTKVATVSQDGVVTAKGIYMTTISATCGEKTVKCKVYVSDPSPESTIPSPTSVKTKVKGNKVTVSWKKNASKKIQSVQVQYSTDKSFLQNVKTKSVKKNKTKVTLKLSKGKTYYIRVRYKGKKGYSEWSGVKTVVLAAEVKKSITLNEQKITISKGEKHKLVATVTGMNKSIKWTSNDKRIATVKAGVVTGKKKGTATITAKCGKLKVTCKVTVNVSYNAKQAISILTKKLKSKNKWKSVNCEAYSVKYCLYDKNGYIDELDEEYGWGNDIDHAAISGSIPKRLGSNRVSCIFEWGMGEGSAFVYAEINLETGKASIYITNEWRKWIKLPKTIQLWQS